MLTHVDLFSGIGGFAIAAQWAGFKTVVFCEIDEYCQEVLKARFGAIADSEDLRWGRKKGNRRHKKDCNGWRGRNSSNQNQIPIVSDIRKFDGEKWRGATLLTGGFPCQPFSVAGKRRGKEDNRYLWPEMFRIIKEAKPSWVLGENVAGIVRMELDQVLADLEGEGYETGTIIIPACAVNAPHRRDRVWIIAHLSGERKESISQQGQRYSIKSKNYDANDTRGEKSRGVSNFKWEKISEIGQTDSDASDAAGSGLSGIRQGEFKGVLLHAQRGSWEENWPEVATRLCRVDDGVPNRVDRLKALGNAIVPQVAYEIIRRIAEIERQIG
jgi:DNA (cytosine-5)-methyltransferase 1